jgi:hypothetical protein
VTAPTPAVTPGQRWRCRDAIYVTFEVLRPGSPEQVAAYGPCWYVRWLEPGAEELITTDGIHSAYALLPTESAEPERLGRGDHYLDVAGELYRVSAFSRGTRPADEFAISLEYVAPPDSRWFATRADLEANMTRVREDRR